MNSTVVHLHKGYQKSLEQHFEQHPSKDTPSQSGLVDCEHLETQALHCHVGGVTERPAFLSFDPTRSLTVNRTVTTSLWAYKRVRLFERGKPPGEWCSMRFGASEMEESENLIQSNHGRRIQRSLYNCFEKKKGLLLA